MTFKILKTSLAMLVIAFLCLAMFSACSSASANAKNDKAKKSKAKRDAAIEEEESESESNTVANKEASNTNSSNTNKKVEVKNSDSEDTKNKANKKEEKKPSNKETSDKTKPDKDKTKIEKKVSPETIWADLMKGNKRFMAGKHTSVNLSATRKLLSSGQKPQVIILGCADSRVPPEFIFDKNLGELFVVRDAGNIADEVSLGSIEYAVEHLHSKMIVVLGHESCGAVAATVSGEIMPSKNLRAITESIAPAFDGSKTCLIGGESNLSCVELNADHSAKDLMLKSPLIKKAVEEGEITIVSAVYKMATGEVVRLK